jgi:hypothetical protein
VNADAKLSPWLIIVQRDAEDLYKHLREAFESDPQVTVVKDRRRADRRALEVPVTGDRRIQDRRRPPAARDEKVWKSLRFHLIHRDEDMTVYEAAGEPPERARSAPTPNTDDEERERAGGGAGARRSASSARPARPRRPGQRRPRA